MKRISRLGLSAVVALGMLSMVPAAVFAAVPACGAVLMSDTTLTGNMDCTLYSGDAVILGKAGITLNLNGYEIMGYIGSDSSDGVTSDKDNVTVKNGTISNSYNGVYFENTNGATIKNLTLHGDPADGSNEGIYVYSGSNNTITNNTVDGYYYGIDHEYAAHGWITNNTVTNSTYGFYFYEDSFDHITGNSAEADYAGFYDDYSGGQTYSGNTADGMSNAGTYGFYLDCDGYGWITATNNVAMFFNDYGFYFYECHDENNINSGTKSLIRGNKAVDNGDDAYGFYDYYSIRAIWDGNVSKRNASYGFYLDYPGKVIFRNNIANHNGDDGIYVDDNSGPAYNFKSFANNRANYNDGYGIDASSYIVNASGNVAKHNVSAPPQCWNVKCN